MPFRKVGELSPSLENYLEAIYFQIAENGVARVKDIAKRTEVGMSSVNAALGRLVSEGYVRHSRYEFIELTEDGVALAEKIVRRHELLRKFLVNILQVDPEKGEKDACQIEHQISAETMDRLTRFVAFLERCSISGDSCIERFHECFYAQGKIEDCSECRKLRDTNPELAATMVRGRRHRRGQRGPTLADLAPGRSGRVTRVHGWGPIHRRLLDMGIVPGAPVKVERIAPLGDPIKIKLQGYDLSLRKAEARSVEVELDDEV